MTRLNNAIPVAVTPDGGVLAVRHTEDHRVEGVIMDPLAEGAPANGRALYDQDDKGVLRRIDLSGDGPVVQRGPSKVTSDKYRKGWESSLRQGEGQLSRIQKDDLALLDRILAPGVIAYAGISVSSSLPRWPFRMVRSCAP